MRLLNANTLRLESFNDERKIPQYTIFSHTWGGAEVTFKDLKELPPSELELKSGFTKIRQCCDKSLASGLEWVWIDTCCIDQSSSAELSEAINSMFEWYRQSSVCFAYLFDVTSSEEDYAAKNPVDEAHGQRISSFYNARWFTRGWCLQELLAPRNMQFFNKYWIYVGSKYSLKTAISEATGIDEYGLLIPDLSVLSVAHRMSWAAYRQTTRPEDIAYCLLGIFNINMPLLYGEGEVKAFGRLQEEIMRRTEDYSIFAWQGITADFGNDMVGSLAPNPSAFRYKNVGLCELPKRVEPLSITGRGIRAHVPLIHRQGTTLAVIGCSPAKSHTSYYAIPITPLKKSADVYRRCAPDLQEVSLAEVHDARIQTIFLLRHSQPTHLEENDNIQVWLSLLEMKDCIYRIEGAYPALNWNFGRRVFAFTPPDWAESQGQLSAAIAFSSAAGKRFALVIDLVISERSSALRLIEIKPSASKDLQFANVESNLRSLIETQERSMRSDGCLHFDLHAVRAIIEPKTVFEQELLEVRITIR